LPISEARAGVPSARRLRGLEVQGAINGSKDVGGSISGGIVNGDGRTDSNNAKDFFGGSTTRSEGWASPEGTAGGVGETLVDNSVTVGILAYSGKSTYENNDGIEYDDKATYLIGHVSAWVGDLNLLESTRPRRTTTRPETARARHEAWFIEADYVLYPWLIPILRYENTRRETQTP